MSVMRPAPSNRSRRPVLPSEARSASGKAKRIASQTDVAAISTISGNENRSGRRSASSVSAPRRQRDGYRANGDRGELRVERVKFFGKRELQHRNSRHRDDPDRGGKRDSG